MEQPKPMSSISASELSRRIGRSRAAISKLARRGIIPQTPDGRFDEFAVRRAYAKNTNPSWRKPLKPAERDLASATPVATETEAFRRDPSAICYRVLVEEGFSIEAAISLEDARKVEIILRCRRLAQDIAELEREYVARSPMQRHIEEALSALLAEAMAIPDRYGARIAAELGRTQPDVKASLSKVFTVLTKETDLAPMRLFGRGW